MLNDSINFLHAVPPTVGFSEGYALLCQFFVIGFGYSVVNGRKPLLRVRGQVRVGCKDVAHGVGTGCHGRFAHCQIFVNFQWVVAIGDVVYHLRIYANVIGGNICRQFTCFFLPEKMDVLQCVDTVLAESVIFRSGEHKVVFGALSDYFIEQISVQAGTVYSTHVSDDGVGNSFYVGGYAVASGSIIQLYVCLLYTSPSPRDCS